MHLLVGDIGGTNARLALTELRGDDVHLKMEKVYPSRNYREPGELLIEFLAGITEVKVAWGCLGVAGPDGDAHPAGYGGVGHEPSASGKRDVSSWNRQCGSG